MKPKKITAKDGTFSFLPSADIVMHMDDGTAVNVRVRPAFVHMRGLDRAGKTLALAVLGHSTIGNSHVLLSRDIAVRIVEKLSKMIKAVKSKTKPVVNVPAIIVLGLKDAIKNGSAEIVLTSEVFNALDGMGDPSIMMASSTAKSALDGRDIRIQVDVSDDVVLDVTPVSWPKKSAPKQPRRPASKTAN